MQFVKELLGGPTQVDMEGQDIIVLCVVFLFVDSNSTLKPLVESLAQLVLAKVVCVGAFPQGQSLRLT
jgi:hypothetical protein